MTDDRDLAALLRRGMSSHASSIGDATALAERIIGQAAPADSINLLRSADHSERTRARWQTWLMPLAAAAAVAVLVGSVVIGVRLIAGRGTQPAGQPLPAPGATSTPTQPSVSPSPSTGASTTVGSGLPPTAAVAAGFRVYDLTWTGPDTGWALGTAPCGSGRCAQIAHTVDGGHSWSALPALPAAMQHDIVNCNAQCVSGLRFADTQTGYAFGIDRLYLTRDGGHSWQAQSLPAGAGGGTAQLLGLEIGNGTALRLLAGCLPGCDITVQRSAVGGSSWSTVASPSGSAAADVQLARAGSTVVVRSSGNAAGGAGRATSTLYVSTDDGTSWRTVAEPCPQRTTTAAASGEVDTSDVSVASDGTIAVLCTPRQSGTGTIMVMTSTDGGKTFTAATTSPGAGGADHLAAVSARTLLVSVNGLQRTDNGGSNWRRVLGPVNYLGFESAQVGRAVTGGTADDPGSATVWTTTDAGASWTSYTFPG